MKWITQKQTKTKFKQKKENTRMFNIKVFVKVEDTKIARIENLKESGARVKLKFVFSENPKNNSRLVQKID